MNKIKINCPFCKKDHSFKTLFPTLPLDNIGLPPQSVYTETTDATHFDNDDTSVISASFINRCDGCYNEFKFAVCVGLVNPRGIDAENEIAVAFLTGKFEEISINEIEHDWFVSNYATGKLIGEEAILAVTKPFPMAKFRINDDDQMDAAIQDASTSLNVILLKQLN